jgi:hypothetical protein
MILFDTGHCINFGSEQGLTEMFVEYVFDLPQ